MWPIPLTPLLFIVCRIFLSSLTLCNTSLFLTRWFRQTFSIFLQHAISKLEAHCLSQRNWQWQTSRLPSARFLVSYPCLSGARVRLLLQCVWNLTTQGDAREWKWRGNWQMEWVASTLTLPRNMVYPALLPLMRTPRLPAVDWADAPTDLNGFVRFGERRNLVYELVPSRFKRTIP